MEVKGTGVRMLQKNRCSSHIEGGILYLIRTNRVWRLEISLLSGKCREEGDIDLVMKWKNEPFVGEPTLNIMNSRFLL